MRSASSRISTVSSRSPSSTLASSNCAAPRMPDSGFLISCAKTADMPVTLRAAPRNFICRSRARAALLSCSVTSTQPGSSSMGVACTVMPRLCRRGLSRVRSCSEIVVPWRRTCARTEKIGLSGGTSVARVMLASCSRDTPRNCSAAWLAKRNRSCASSSTTGTGRAPSRAWASINGGGGGGVTRSTNLSRPRAMAAFMPPALPECGMRPGQSTGRRTHPPAP